MAVQAPAPTSAGVAARDASLASTESSSTYWSRAASSYKIASAAEHSSWGSYAAGTLKELGGIWVGVGDAISGMEDHFYADPIGTLEDAGKGMARFAYDQVNVLESFATGGAFGDQQSVARNIALTQGVIDYFSAIGSMPLGFDSGHMIGAGIVAPVALGFLTGGVGDVVGGALSVAGDTLGDASIAAKLKFFGGPAKYAGDVVPALGRPFRAASALNPANEDVLKFMQGQRIQGLAADEYVDCSEIMERLFDQAGGVGKKIMITPVGRGSSVYVPEFKVEEGIIKPERYDYHYVYKEDGYIYDPRVSTNAIPSGDYFKLLKMYNPTGFTYQEEIFTKYAGIIHKGVRL